MGGLATTWGGAGYAVSDHSGRYIEDIAPRAFPGATSGRDVVELRVEHQHAGPPIAATGRSGTMTLSDTAEGLLLRAILPKADPDCVAAVSKAQRGLLDRMSIGFTNADSDWNSDRSRRTVRSAPLVEVSLVHRPANPAAVVTMVRREPHAEDSALEFRYGPEITVIDGRAGLTGRGHRRVGARR